MTRYIPKKNRENGSDVSDTVFISLSDTEDVGSEEKLNNEKKNEKAGEAVSGNQSIRKDQKAAGPAGQGAPKKKNKKSSETVLSQDEPKKKSRKKILPAILIPCGILTVIIIAVIVFAVYMTSGFRKKELDKNDLGIVATTTKDRSEDEQYIQVPEIKNIAFFGIDTRNSSAEFGDQYRSDSIMVVSINKKEDAIKMTSILRDSKVPIEGHDPQKINAAYKFGGPTLAIHTLNTNFKLDIEDYVTVDFGQLQDVIEIIGGVDIDLTEEEAEYVNSYVSEVVDDCKQVQAGVNTLNGIQALQYSRIRKLDSDYYRASRQQTVLTAIFEKIKKTPSSQYPMMIKELLECVETSLSYTEILSYAMTMDISTAELIKNTIPDENYEEGLWGGVEEDTGSWVWIYDIDAAAQRLHDIIYD